MKYIENSKDFFVNEFGEVFREGKKLTPHSGGVGDKYYKQRIYNLDGTVYRKNIHRLVAETWLPNPNNLPCVNHKNGDKRDNRVSNLEWCTFQHNNQHAFDIGLNGNVLEDHHQAILTNTEIHELCKLMQDGWRNCELAEKYGISKHIPAQIRKGITWTSIASQYNVKRQRAKRISEDTVRWVCEQMQQGLKNQEIRKLANNPSITASMLSDIKARRRWVEISKDYNF